MNEDVLDALAAAAEDGVACDGLEASLEGDGYRLAVPGGTHESLDGAGLRERAREYPEYVGNWYCWEALVPPGDDRRAFLRWVETDGVEASGNEAVPETVPERYDRLREGVVAEWGQLRITTALDLDGELPSAERTYDVRHVDDAGVPVADLEPHDDPLDAREIATLDDDGRYRPLKTAPSLRTGWTFPACSPAELVRVVDFVYPATIPNWYRERQGDLDVDHWLPTAERQTGIYDLIDELPREAVDWVAEACCVDSQCLRRREWEYEEGDELDADGGDGPFPCREPCSVVISAARRWTIAESETERTYEFRLTPTEKRQLEELVDAVADGRVDEVREADLGDGANRYRARYLRAKRFEDGEIAEAEERED